MERHQIYVLDANICIDLFQGELLKQGLVGQKILAEGTGYMHFVMFPCDVQYPPVDQELRGEYPRRTVRITLDSKCASDGPALVS